jgi:hypothetical protein
MARPRMAKSARITQRNLDTGRIAGRPGTAMPGAVDAIIPKQSSKKGTHVEVSVAAEANGRIVRSKKDS